ncbi:MAG TPA: formate dehydrogenase accessory sulfurtransferase FdhD [Micromonosporaceae bacterium]|nr:formate dehydrogenase accessory sulfurtransferase FdhD [Micromonosporaceae bacterium]HCU52129.1 formate dehydrogenase accessory sulfurtransferase FdhD [Micromonosporaceae bacterium]
MSISYARRPVFGKAPDTLVVEEPLEVQVNGKSLAVTMRTPGNELELALGFLYTEGIIAAPSDVVSAKLCNDNPNVVEVFLERETELEARNFYTTSSCGVCGKASIDSVRVHSHHDVNADALRVARGTLFDLPEKLRAAQRGFSKTGGSHAAGIFTATGELVVAREDVGRHNALDKAIGTLFQRGALPLAGHVIMVSGRASFELTQKAWVAGASMLAAVSAPSTLAVDLATEAGMTLIGFLRGESMNVYSRPDRVV